MQRTSVFDRFMGWFNGLQCSLAAVVLATSAVAGAQTAAPQVVQVQPGDTFSAIAARYTGSAANWRKVYRSQLSRLPNPNVISVGMRFELVNAADGSQYLRLLAPGASAVAAGATPAAPMTPASPTPTTSATPAPAAPAAVAPSASSELVIGVLPNIPTAQLAPSYEHLRQYLERGGESKVRIVIPANFKAFFDATMRGDYDLAVSAPNLARVAQADRNMQPLVIYEPRINALFVTPIETTVNSPRDVRERAVAFANPTSLVALYGQQWLRQQGMEPGKDYEIKPARTDLGVGRMLLSGDAVAAIMSNGEFRSLPPEESARLKIFEVFARVPNFVVLAHPRLERERMARLKSQLKVFIADKDSGAAFSRTTGITGMTEPDEAQLRELDVFTPITRRAMSNAN